MKDSLLASCLCLALGLAPGSSAAERGPRTYLARDSAGAAATPALPSPGTARERRSPWLAGLLAVVPGAGQMYNRQWTLGGIILAADIGLYLAAAATAGLLDPHSSADFRWDSAFLLSLAAGIHLVAAFDAVLEVQRHNRNLARWSVSILPHRRGLGLAYGFSF
ncbi:MAG: hypothetical protein DRI34_03740 [Deltaproteobacteria bacterium]|nr:MAG: hypothetical protein DRI34_03740 [Deltaproteobacteria bacterium]